MATVCVLGSINLDRTSRVAALPRPGETVLASSTSTAPGGKGGNQAIAAARAGARVSLVAALGDDAAADELRAHLRAGGVGLDAVATAPGPSGSAIILVDDDAENVIVVAPGANAACTTDSPTARAALDAADVLLMQLEIPVATAIDAARRARAAGAVVMLNASPPGADPDALAELAALTDVVVVNEDEAANWRWPVAHLVTTLGARGARHDGDTAFAATAPAVHAVDTSGAGDVFAGVLAAEWLRGPGDALRRACAAGALATTVAGAGDCAPTAAAVDALLAGDGSGR